MAQNNWARKPADNCGTLGYSRKNVCGKPTWNDLR